MKKRIYRLAPCADYDMEHCESWLQDMAKEGWFLKILQRLQELMDEE